MLALELRPCEIQETEERFEHARALDRRRSEDRLTTALRERLDFGIGANSGQIALVELDDERHVAERDAELLQIFSQIEQRRRVVLRLGELRVGDECHAVGALQNEAPRRSMQDLPRNREHLQTKAHVAALGFENERQHVEEKRAIVARLERHEPAVALLARELVERFQIRGFPGKRGPVINELDRDFAGGEIELHVDRRILPDRCC